MRCRVFFCLCGLILFNFLAHFQQQPFVCLFFPFSSSSSLSILSQWLHSPCLYLCLCLGPLLFLPCPSILPLPSLCVFACRCRMCAATFFSKSDMQIHSKSHTEAKPHKCPHCAKSFANSSYLAQHIRIHSGAKPYTCSYCQKSFRQLSHLQQHTRYCRNPAPTIQLPPSPPPISLQIVLLPPKSTFFIEAQNS